MSQSVEWKLLNIRLSGLLPCSEAADAGEAAEVDDHISSTTTVSSMPPEAPGALPVLPLGINWACAGQLAASRCT